MNKAYFVRALAALAIVVASSSVADAADFSGTWAISATLGNPVIETTVPVCVFRQSGAKISGTCKGPSAAGPAAGVVNGNEVIWEWHKIPTNPNQVNSVATYKGTFTGGVLRGTWTDSYNRGLVGPPRRLLAGKYWATASPSELIAEFLRVLRVSRESKIPRYSERTRRLPQFD